MCAHKSVNCERKYNSNCVCLGSVCEMISVSGDQKLLLDFPISAGERVSAGLTQHELGLAVWMCGRVQEC